MKITGSGINVKPLIEAKGLAITEVARSAGHDPAYIHHLLSGRLKVTVEMSKKLEAVTGIQGLAQILCGFEPMPDIAKAS